MRHDSLQGYVILHAKYYVLGFLLMRNSDEATSLCYERKLKNDLESSYLRAIEFNFNLNEVAYLLIVYVFRYISSW
jgi:hypothetical protein